MTDTKTIRLSDRLELRPTGSGISTLYRDEMRVVTLGPTTAEALIEACNPSRLILPPGVIHGSDGKFYAPGHAAEGLDRDLWTPFTNETAIISRLSPYANYEVRPTAANPLPTLPDTCWQIPDGRINCLRKDAQALRDMGWTIHYTDDGAKTPATSDRSESYVVEARPPAKPDTERVPWWEAVGRTLDCPRRKITEAGTDGTGPWLWLADEGRTRVPIASDGQVEVLR